VSWKIRWPFGRQAARDVLNKVDTLDAEERKFIADEIKAGTGVDNDVRWRSATGGEEHGRRVRALSHRRGQDYPECRRGGKRLGILLSVRRWSSKSDRHCWSIKRQACDRTGYDHWQPDVRQYGRGAQT
jgi:hypothetical protein